jgi:mannosyltransferase
MDLPDIVVANMHRRRTGVSATVAALVPVQRAGIGIAVIDAGGLGLGGEWRFRDVVRAGWTAPARGRFRVWHARRNNEMQAGLFLRDVLRQPWKLVFTSAAPRRHGAVLRAVMGRMDAVVATSARAAGFLDWHSLVVPHGVDTGLFHPPADRAAEWRAGGLPGHRGIGAFGRIRPSKGSDLFVEAMCRLLPQYPGWTAFLTGLCQDRDRGFLDALRARIARAGLCDRIFFLGDLEPAEVRAWYRRASLVVAASRSEGFGLTPLEAFASGAPAVASHAGAWPDLVTPDVGALFATGDADSLVAALRPLLADPARVAAMGQAARSRAEERHSIVEEAAALNALYAELQAGRVAERRHAP